MAVVLLFVLFFALINLLVDLLYALIDPRIRAGIVGMSAADIELLARRRRFGDARASGSACCASAARSSAA